MSTNIKTEGVTGSSRPRSISTDGFDALGVQNGVTKKVSLDLLTKKADFVALKTDVDKKVNRSEIGTISAGIKRYKPDVPTQTALPITGNEEGDGRKVLDDLNPDGLPFIWLWDGTSWGRTVFTSFPSDIVRSGGYVGTAQELNELKVNKITVGNISTSIFSKDELFISTYIDNIIAEKTILMDDSVIYKPNGEYRKFAIRNIDTTVEPGRFVLYREDDTGVLGSFIDLINTEWLETRVIKVTKDGLIFTIYLKEIPVNRLYPISDYNILNIEIFDKMLLRYQTAGLSIDVNEINNQLFGEPKNVIPIDSRLDTNTELKINSENIGIGAGSWWQIRFPGQGQNKIEKIDDYFKVTLEDINTTSFSAFWAINKLDSNYVGKEINIEFELKSDSTESLSFIIGGISGGKVINPTNEWIVYKYTMVVSEQYPDMRVMFYKQYWEGIQNFYIRNIAIIDTATSSTIRNKIDALDNRINEIENIKQFENSLYTDNLPALVNGIGKINFEEIGVVNIGLAGDSWTHGVGSVSTGLITYVKYFAQILWDKYGYAGLGWFDFGLSNNTDMMCADDEAVNYSKSGILTYINRTSGALGINYAHTIMSPGANYTLQFNQERKVDKATIWFYNNANFNLTINDSTTETISASSSGGWQSKIITGDINKISITAITDNTIVFGIDLSYGNKGIKVHKLGCRGLTTSQTLIVNIDNWKEGFSKLNLDFFSVLLFTNDRSGNINPQTVASNIFTLLDYVSEVYPFSDKVIITPSETKGGTGQYPVSEYSYQIYNICKSYQIPFIDLAPIVGDPDKITYLNTFVDNLHPDKRLNYMIAEFLINKLFPL